nr:J27 [uncultured bacterium]
MYETGRVLRGLLDRLGHLDEVVPSVLFDRVLHLNEEVALRRAIDLRDTVQGCDDLLALVDAGRTTLAVAAIGRGAEGFEGLLVAPETHDRVPVRLTQVLRDDRLDKAVVRDHGAVDPGEAIPGFLAAADTEVEDLVEYEHLAAFLSRCC